MATDGSALAASEIEVGSIYPTMQERRREAGRYVRCWCGVWMVKRVPPYLIIRMGGIGWNYGGPLIG